jgi:hypothetical protein
VYEDQLLGVLLPHLAGVEVERVEHSVNCTHPCTGDMGRSNTSWGRESVFRAQFVERGRLSVVPERQRPWEIDLEHHFEGHQTLNRDYDLGYCRLVTINEPQPRSTSLPLWAGVTFGSSADPTIDRGGAEITYTGVDEHRNEKSR